MRKPDDWTKNLALFWFIPLLVISLAGCTGSPAEQEPPPAADTQTPTYTPTPEPLPSSTPTPTDPPQVIELPWMHVTVPLGAAVELDGKISPGEWDQAAVYLFEDGSELLLMHADDYLYLAIRSGQPGMIVGNIYLQRGDEVSVLHSSAALGTAKFTWQAGVWTRIQNFTWRCRDIGFSETAETKRTEFLQEEGWLAANPRMGTPNELEYKISLTEEISALAVNILQELEPNPFPAGLADDCVQAFPGGIPEVMHFAIQDWTSLELTQE